MTVSAFDNGRAQIAGDGVSGSVDLDFQFVDENDLLVVHTDSSGVNTVWNYSQSPGDWAFTGGDFASGTVTFTPADLALGEYLTVTLVSNYAQPYSLEGGEINPDVIGAALDRMALSIQAVAAVVQRAIVISASVEGDLPDYTLPDLPDGYGIVRSGSGLIAAPIDSGAISAGVTAAEAAQAAAETAEDNAEGSASAAASSASAAATSATNSASSATAAAGSATSAATSASNAAAAATAAVAAVAADLDTAEVAIADLETNVAALQSSEFGVGQTLTDVTASRAVSTSYQNTTGKPIEVIISGNSGGATRDFEVSVDNSVWVPVGTITIGSGSICITFTVQNGEYYRVNGAFNVSQWSERR